jgi:L-aminopeptidase/D-esterase-like protein
MALGCAVANASTIDRGKSTRNGGRSCPSLPAALRLDCSDGYLAPKEDRF